jgi:hypothetical protein
VTGRRRGGGGASSDREFESRARAAGVLADRELEARASAAGVAEPGRTERLELRLTPEESAAWTALAEREGTSVAKVVRAAMKAYAGRGEADAFAELGREVAALVAAHAPARRR